jgi:aminoglycoside phosphotransferase (APT) family kinase protein
LAREVDVAHGLAEVGSPVAGLDPRVEPRLIERDDFAISLWTAFEPVSRPLPAAEYGEALGRLHAGLRHLEIDAPHVMDRVAVTQRDLADRDVTPDLAETDRAFLAETLRDLSASIVRRRPRDQLLHGEPHPGNVLHTADGPRFVDFERTAHGPVEFDLAWVPDEVSRGFADADGGLVDECRGVVLAIIAIHRWSRGDHHPSGRPSGLAFLDAVRSGPPWPSLDAVTW